MESRLHSELAKHSADDAPSQTVAKQTIEYIKAGGASKADEVKKKLNEAKEKIIGLPQQLDNVETSAKQILDEAIKPQINKVPLAVLQSLGDFNDLLHRYVVQDKSIFKGMYKFIRNSIFEHIRSTYFKWGGGTSDEDELINTLNNVIGPQPCVLQDVISCGIDNTLLKIKESMGAPLNF